MNLTEQIIGEGIGGRRALLLTALDSNSSDFTSVVNSMELINSEMDDFLSTISNSSNKTKLITAVKRLTNMVKESETLFAQILAASKKIK